MSRSARLALAVLCTAALVGGCGTTQRPLPKVLGDARHAFEFAQYDRAATDYREYIDRRPDAAEVRFELARAYLLLGQPKPAREQLSVAHDVSPTNERYADALAEAYFQAGEIEPLLGFLNRRATERGNAEDFLRLGAYSARVGHADEALVAMTTAARLDRGHSIRPQLALADFYASVGDRANELRRLCMALWLEPQNQVLWGRIRAMGEVPGPALAIQPEELD